MSGDPINIMAALKDVSKRGKTGEKFAITITTDDLFFDPNDKAMAAAVVETMVSQIRANLEQGKGPGGEVLPAITQATRERRTVEVRQATRSGAAADRYDDQAFRSQVLSNFMDDYTAPRLGHFTPKEGSTRGKVSGMLAASFAARPSSDGRSMTIYVAAKRGRPRPSKTDRPAEKLSALQSVFHELPMWSPAAYASPAMQAAMKRAAKALLGKSPAELRRQWMRLAKGVFGVAKEALATAAELGEKDE